MLGLFDVCVFLVLFWGASFWLIEPWTEPFFIRYIFFNIKYSFLQLGCVQFVYVGSPGSAALLETCDVKGHMVHRKALTHKSRKCMSTFYPSCFPPISTSFPSTCTCIPFSLYVHCTCILASWRWNSTSMLTPFVHNGLLRSCIAAKI